MVEMKKARRNDDISLALDFFKSTSGKMLVKRANVTRIKVVDGMISKTLRK
jgi:hypothetical protein